MELRNPELPPPPPGAVRALVNGFNTVANNVGVILFPIALDVFLWLGPRLRPTAFTSLIRQIQPPVEQAELFNAMREEIVNGFNLFSTLRTLPLGVFSLMSTNLSSQSPLGARIDLGLSDWFLIIISFFTLTFLGWLGGSFYFRAVAIVSMKRHNPGIFHAAFHGVLLSGLWAATFVIFGLPILIFMGIISLLGSAVQTVIAFLLIIPASWCLIAVFFSCHGVFTDAQNAFVSIWNGFRIVRYSLPTLSWFSILAIIIDRGMDLLWLIPPATSWMTVVGICGHAFVSTSLLAASFIYYHDLNTWIESALQWLKTQKTSSARA